MRSSAYRARNTGSLDPARPLQDIQVEVIHTDAIAFMESAPACRMHRYSLSDITPRAAYCAHRFSQRPHREERATVTARRFAGPAASAHTAILKRNR
jgi:hypothetical protein